MNSKRIATVSNGYTVTKMSIAVVVNQQRLAAILGKDATPEQIAARVAEIQKLVASATGFSETRGDIINVSAVEFIDGLDGEAIEQPGILASVGQHAGTMINAAAFIVVVFLVAFFGLRPMVGCARQGRAGARRRRASRRCSARCRRPNPPLPASPTHRRRPWPARRPGSTPLDDLRQKIRPAPQDRLARMVDLNEERTAHILRKWAHQEAQLMSALALFDVLPDFGSAAAAPRRRCRPAASPSRSPEAPRAAADIGATIVRAEVAKAEAALERAPDARSTRPTLRGRARQSHAAEIEASSPQLRRAMPARTDRGAVRRDGGAASVELDRDRRGAHPRRRAQRRAAEALDRQPGALDPRGGPRRARPFASTCAGRNRCSRRLQRRARRRMPPISTIVEAPGFDLTVAIDGNLFETRLSEWSAALSEILA